jgi:Domain of unknown function (DUF397)
MEDTNLTNWRKASYSSNGGANCVEVASGHSRVLVRDTTDRTGPMLAFSSAAWRRLVAQVKRSLATGPNRVCRHLQGALARLGAGAPFTAPGLGAG